MALANVGFPAQQAFAAQSAVTAVGSFDFGAAHNYHSLFVVAGTGCTGGVVAIELSNDNTNWFAPATNTVTTSAPGVFSVTVGPLPFEFVRARISTLISGGTVTAYIASA